jgi:hypothetical protein
LKRFVPIFDRFKIRFEFERRGIIEFKEAENTVTIAKYGILQGKTSEMSVHFSVEMLQKKMTPKGVKSVHFKR